MSSSIISNDVILNIVSYLDPETILSLGHINKRFYDITSSSKIWERCIYNSLIVSAHIKKYSVFTKYIYFKYHHCYYKQIIELKDIVINSQLSSCWDYKDMSIYNISSVLGECFDNKLNTLKNFVKDNIEYLGLFETKECYIRSKKYWTEITDLIKTVNDSLLKEIIEMYERKLLEPHATNGNKQPFITIYSETNQYVPRLNLHFVYGL